MRDPGEGPCHAFMFKVGGSYSLEVFVDLDKHLMRAFSPETVQTLGPYCPLALSTNLDERAALGSIVNRREERASVACRSLSPGLAADMRRLLSPEALRVADGMSDKELWRRTGSWGYCDGWGYVFVAYGNDGDVIARTSDISAVPPAGKEENYQLLFSLLQRLGIMRYARGS